jgi:membrane associated rhomboid family serine protease
VVFIPLSDENPLRSIHFQWVTVSLIAVNTIAFVLGSMQEQQSALASFALIPSELFEVQIIGGAVPFPNQALQVPEGLTLITYQFLHGDIFHLLSNMLFLWVFGDNIEDAMGHLRFIMFYLMCGIFAGLVHSWMMPNSDLPLIGASGAVAGIISAYLILHPKVKVWVLALWRIPIKLNASWALGIWVAAQVASLFFDSEENVAWWAHIGGLAAGAVLILFMRRRGVVLFDKTPGGA